MNSDNERRAAPCEVPPERKCGRTESDGRGSREPRMPERHPLEPFLPSGARLLMLGSFPPQRKRWSMDFFYPNLQNDMWRIVGHLFFGDRHHFLRPDRKAFDRERIASFCAQCGIALYDTAEEVIRLKDNASDNFLEVVRETDLAALLDRIPQCCAVVTTGQKATDTLCRAVSGGRKRGLCAGRPHPASLSHALVVAGLSPAPGVESGVLPGDVRRMRHAARVRSAAGGRSMSREFAGG